MLGHARKRNSFSENSFIGLTSSVSSMNPTTSTPLSSPVPPGWPGWHRPSWSCSLAPLSLLAPSKHQQLEKVTRQDWPCCQFVITDRKQHSLLASHLSTGIQVSLSYSLRQWLHIVNPPTSLLHSHWLLSKRKRKRYWLPHPFTMKCRHLPGLYIPSPLPLLPESTPLFSRSWILCLFLPSSDVLS